MRIHTFEFLKLPSILTLLLISSLKASVHQTMLLTVEDNGSGMSPDEMNQLNARLHEPIQIDTESYGLKNLHQRLQLFYGNDCGLTISQNPNSKKGLSIEIKALKITCDEYAQRN